MHNIKSIGYFFIISIVLLCKCATIHEMDSTKLNVINAEELMSGQAKLEVVIKSIQNGNTHVFKITKGQQIPLEININLPIMNIEPVKNKIVFTRDTYLLISKSEMKISPDGRRWADIGDITSIKKLYGINKQGQLSVGYGLKKDEGAFFSLDIKTD